MTASGSPLLAAALELARQGFAILALHDVGEGGECSCGKRDCGSAGKHPRTRNGSKDATTDEGKIRAWWTRWPSANVGVATGEASGVDVLDVDGETGEAELARLEKEHEPLPSTVSARTGRGRHPYFRRDPARPFRNRVRFAAGLDTRGSGGYVVAPPSLHASGKLYEWESDRGPGETDLAPAPGWLLDLVTKEPEQAKSAENLRAGGTSSTTWPAAYVRAAVERELATVRSAREGTRNDAVNRAAFALAALEAGGAEIGDAFVRLREGALASGLGDTEAERTIASGRAAGSAKPRTPPSPSARGERRRGRSDGGEGKKGLATILVELALAQDLALFHAPDSTAYAAIRVGDERAAAHQETWPVRSRRFGGWLARLCYAHAGIAPGRDALAAATNVLEARALHDGPEEPVFVRVAPGPQGAIYIDLGDLAWRAVEVTPQGWRVVPDAPVHFRRSPLTRPLPEPARGGSLDELWNVSNVPREARPLVAAWLVAALRPAGPYPVLAISGEQGSAKSSLSRALCSLVDPANVELRSLPKELRDLAISASHAWVLAFENLSAISEAFSDAFCRIATGGGFVCRALFTDGDEVLFDAKRPLLLNGITSVIERADLADRALVISLPRIPEEKRRTERELVAAIEVARPRILGALLDGVSAALAHVETVRLDRLPRMADFALWAVAAEEALGFAPGSFMAAYLTSQSEASESALEADPVAGALRTFAEQRAPWLGTAAELLTELESLVVETVRKEKSWPRMHANLARRLPRLAPPLRAVGIDVARLDRREGGSGRRLWAIARVRESARDGREDRASPPHAASRASSPAGEAREACEAPADPSCSDLFDDDGDGAAPWEH